MAIPVGVQENDILVSTAQVGNNINEFYPAGTEFIVHKVDGDYLLLEPVKDLDGGIWFYFFADGGAPDNTGLFVIQQ